MNKIDAHVIVLDSLNWSSEQKQQQQKPVTICANMTFAKVLEIVLKVQ